MNRSTYKILVDSPLQLKSVKHAEFASQETACFDASVYWKGKRVAHSRNDGHGGANHTIPHDYKNRAVFDAAMAEIKTYCAALPKLAPLFEGDTGMAWDDELLISYQVERFLIERDTKKALKRITIKADGATEYRQYGATLTPTIPNCVRAKDKEEKEQSGMKCINLMDFEDAVMFFNNID